MFNSLPESLRSFVLSFKDGVPFVLTVRKADVATVLLVSEIRGGLAYGVVLLYYRKNRDMWERYSKTDGRVEWKPTGEPGESFEDALAREYRRLELESALSAEENEAMCSISRLRLDTVIGRGKYAGRTVGDVLRTDRDYIEWAIANMDGFKDKIY